MTLREQLLSERKLDWLDVGTGHLPKLLHFRQLDILPARMAHPSVRANYIELDIVKATELQLRHLGQFDLVRCQHTLEHMSFEDGASAILNMARLLKVGGYLLLTVPDLLIHVERYLKHDYQEWSPGWLGWARERVPVDAPPSVLFSMFSHSKPDEPHLWCYDVEGLIYQISRSGQFEDIRELKLTDPLAEEPFTHNRPNEDACVLAVKS